MAARLLEIEQGWLYNYFVFTDDDADFAKGDAQSYESFLQQWQPAIGVPGYVSRYYHHWKFLNSVEYLHHIDIPIEMRWSQSLTSTSL